MGLMLARAGAALGGPVAMTTAGFGLGGAAATGVVMAGQYAYGGDFNTPQTKPEAMNWTTAGVGTVGGIVGAVTGSIQASDYDNPGGRKAMFASIGMVVGSIAGAMLVAPTIRRMKADD